MNRTHRQRRVFLTVCLLITLAAALFAQTSSPFAGQNVTTGQDNAATPAGESRLQPTSAVKTDAGSIAWIRQDMARKSGSTVIVIKDNVNVRSGPATTYQIVTVAALGTSFSLLETQNGWYKVSLKAPAAPPAATPEQIEAAQNEFLAAYKVYTQAALKGGRNSAAAQKALAGFKSSYATYKALAQTSQDLKNIRAGKATVDKVVISKTDFTSTVYSNGKVVRVFPIAYGANPDGLNKKMEGDSRTPEGTFKIANKAKNPAYKNIPGGVPSNPLGTRWMGLNTWGGSIGMHGTSAPASIGSRASHGCVRMYTADAEELFDLVRVGTPVIIEPVKSN